MQGKVSGIDNFLGDRLRKWRKTLPLRAYQLAKIIQISQGSLSDIENNKSLPSADTLAKLFLKTDLNIIWLLTAKGPMEKTRMSEEEIWGGVVNEDTQAYGHDHALQSMIDCLIRIYHRGDPEKRAHILGYLVGADPGE